MGNNEKNKKYDLEERTTRFAENIIQFVRKIPKDIVTASVISQLVRSGTSVGANFCEADDAESKKDFKHKIGICKKESRETKYWLRIVGVTNPQLKEDSMCLWQEAKELNLIFNAINNKLK